MRVAGLDICKGYAVAWILDSIPDDIRLDWKNGSKLRSRKPDEDEFTFFFCADQLDKNSKERVKRGLDTFLRWEVDAVCMEPTGLHYAHFIANVCEAHHIRVLWVSHEVCKGWRSNHKLPDKNDLADAYALAVYGITYHAKPSYFIRFENGNLLKLRDLYHFRKFIVRMAVKCCNRSQQHLAYEFPESAALFKDAFSTSKRDGRRPLLAQVAGRSRSSIASPWKNRLSSSVAKKYGVQVSDLTRYLATMTDDLDIKLADLDSQISNILNTSQFSVYNQVFDRFRFGLNLRSILLVLIYPFSERFPPTVNISDNMARFKRRVGLARIETQSGSSIKGEKTGSSSSLCRTEFYMWVSSIIKLKGIVFSSELSQIKAYHDLKDSELKADPAKLSEMVAKRYQDSLRSKMLVTLSESLGKAEALQVVSAIDWSAKAPSFREKTRAVGNLVIAKTAGYTAKQLFKALWDVRDYLDLESD